jgi:uncharacterized membrane protein YhaH (DUF805 family)
VNAREFFGSMFDPLKRVTDFSSRSTRAQFWPFIFLYYALSQIASFIAISPFMNRINALSAAQAEGEPDPEAFAALFSDGLFADMISRSLWATAILALLFLIPLAGAVTRRLHDTNRSGLWALPCLILLVSSLVMMWQLFARYKAQAPTGVDFEQLLSPFLLLLANNVVYLICVITLIVFCAQDGTVGANRFGEDPKGRDPAEEAERAQRLAEARKMRESSKMNTGQARPPARLVK